MHRTHLTLPIQMLWKGIVARRRTLLAVVQHPGWTVHRHSILNRRNWMRASLIRAKVASDVVCCAHKPLPHQMVRCVTVVTTIGGIHLTNWPRINYQFQFIRYFKKTSTYSRYTFKFISSILILIYFDFLNVKFLCQCDFVHFFIFFTRDVCMFCHFWSLRRPLEYKQKTRTKRTKTQFILFFL